MNFGTTYFLYILGGIAIAIMFFILWALLDKFPKLKKLRNAIEHIIDSIFSSI